ncbi:MAG TPA: YajG family lipoprotein, partial [Rhodocyclaceae bacterium]|nr:YajG family lipoprotein [Rhodocyclaceae bacterium]
GNSLKTLVSNQPVAVVVQNAFADGLRARGVPTSSDAKLSLSGTIQKFESITVIHRGATIAIDLDVTDVASGKKVFSKNFVTDLEEDSGAAGVFASIDDLRKLVERGLRETVDKALDDPEVRHALKM